MLGGTIEVRDSTGHVVITKSIDHRTMYLDFFQLADGKYVITLRHNSVSVETCYTLEPPPVHARRKHKDKDCQAEELHRLSALRIV